MAEELFRLLAPLGWIFCFCKNLEAEASETEQTPFLVHVVRSSSESCLSLIESCSTFSNGGWRSLSLDGMLLKIWNGFALF
jgi:hypothetical protein